MLSIFLLMGIRRLFCTHRMHSAKVGKSLVPMHVRNPRH